MPLCSELFNVFDLRILRPDRSGPGGDQVGPPPALVSGLSAYYEPKERLFRDETDREQIISGRYFITGLDADGEIIPVQEGDLLDHTDFRGELMERQEIVSVKPWMDGAALDHLVLEVGR
jgi:hypothetical protein